MSMSTLQAAPIRHLSLIAFDQRHSFERSLLGLSAPPSGEQQEDIRALQRLIYTGFRLAMRTGARREGAGILVDGHYGADVARAAFDEGPLVALAVERSGQDEFDFEHGEDFGSHIESFDPAFTKVRVRYNPEGESTLNARQTQRLAELTDWLRARGRRFLCELHVPASPSQLEPLGEDLDRYDAELRVARLTRALHELQAGGVEPDVWMLEGLERPADCLRVVRQARAGARDDTCCIIGDRHASRERLEQWLDVAGSTPGFIGFALGPSLWLEPLRALHQRQLTASEAAERICENYQRAQILWERAALRSTYAEQAAASA